MAALMILRELDIDITPVLTGAGIAGLAVGFGAQTLVRDVLSGFFLIFEDQVRVGDVAVVNGQGGLVEEVNLRTFVLRDEKGAVHIFPNGEVKTLANMSKDFSYYVITVGVAYDADVDRAVDAMREAASAVTKDPGSAPTSSNRWRCSASMRSNRASSSSRRESRRYRSSSGWSDVSCENGLRGCSANAASRCRRRT